MRSFETSLHLREGGETGLLYSYLHETQKL